MLPACFYTALQTPYRNAVSSRYNSYMFLGHGFVYQDVNQSLAKLEMKT